MKKFNLCGVAAAALLLLSSCLGDDSGSSQQELNGVLGVVTTSSKTFKTIVRTAYGDLYNETIESLGFTPGNCIQFACKYDSSNPNNANDYANGYAYVTVTKRPENVNSVDVKMSAADTTQLLDKNEIALENPIAGTSVGYNFGVLDGYMFLTSSFKGLTDQKNEWSMYFDMNQTPIVEGGYNTYVFTVRAVKKEEGKTPSGVMGNMNAFRTKSILNQLNAKEYGNKKDRFGIRIQYLKAINEKDSTDLQWATSLPFSYATSKQ